MYLKVCHQHQTINMKEAKQNLCDSGFLSLRDEITQTFNRGVDFLPFTIMPPINIPDNTEIMIRSDGKGLCHIQIEKDAQFVDLHIIAPDANSGKQIANSCGCFGDVGKAHLGSCQEEELVKHIKEKAAKLSPNGKMLHDKNITAYLDNIYSPVSRILLKAIAEVFGGDAVPMEALVESVQSKLSRKATGKVLPALIRKLVTEQKLFDIRYVLACDECGTPVLEFPNQTTAEESLKHTANRKCKICDEGKIKAVEAYAINDTLRKIVDQGLWLEKLTYDSLKPFCTFIEAGRIVDPFELDVIAVCLGQVLLCQCKDTSFGQNDFINLNAVADEVDADIVGVITTQPLHENVERLVKRTRERSRRTTFIIQGSDNPSKITSGISKSLDNIQTDYVKHLFSIPEERFLRAIRRRPLSQRYRYRV